MFRVFLLSAILFLGCNAHAQMAVDFEWKLEHRCSTVSPAFSISEVPAGTNSLVAKMVDNDFTSFDHGGGSVDASSLVNSGIPSGALKSYRGPCPPNFSSFGHDYTWTFQAMDAAGKVLGAATTTKTFSAKTVLK